MTHFIQKSGANLLKLLPITLVLMAGFALAEDGNPLSAEELETLIKGATLAGQITGVTYYITFQIDDNYCLRLKSKDGDCWEVGPWWLEGNTVCRKSDRSGEYCWNVTKLTGNKFQGEITRVKDSKRKLGGKSEFWME